MKKLMLIISAVAFSFSIAFSQGCLPEGITFTNQAQIDSFAINYPNCTEIEGDVYIGILPETDITNLNELNVLNSIGGSMEIAFNDLTNLSGLDNLTSVGENLKIGGTYALVSLAGLEGLTSIGGNLEIGFQSGMMLLGNQSLTSLEGLANLSFLGGNLEIRSNSSLTSLSGLGKISSLDGEYLFIDYNNVLTSLMGLDSINSISAQYVWIMNNSSLSECNAQSICDCLTNPTSSIAIFNNAPGCNSPEEVEAACATVHAEHLVFNNEIIFAPNPFTDQTVLSINFPINGLVNLDIFNNLGMCLKNWRFEGLQTTPIQYYPDFSGIPPGVYYCLIQFGNKVLTSKLIKIY